MLAGLDVLCSPMSASFIVGPRETLIILKMLLSSLTTSYAERISAPSYKIATACGEKQGGYR